MLASQGVGVLRFFRENGVQFGQEKSRKDRTVELRLQLMNLQGRLPIKNRWVHFSTWMLTSRRCSRLLVKGFMWTRMAKKLCLLRDVVKKFSRQDLYGSKIKETIRTAFLELYQLECWHHEDVPDYWLKDFCGRKWRKSCAYSGML